MHHYGIIFAHVLDTNIWCYRDTGILTVCNVLATGEVSRSPIVTALGFLARTESKYILCIVLHKNKRKTVVQSEYSGPISLVSLMGGESYDLHRED